MADVFEMLNKIGLPILKNFLLACIHLSGDFIRSIKIFSIKKACVI
jgi:hypothetical protein